MNKRALRILEYGKIVEMLANECCSRITRDAALKLVPSQKIRWIREELDGTEEAYQVLMKKGAPPLGNFYDISGIVHLAAKEGALTMKQLLEVAYNLSSARRTQAFLSSDLPELPRISGYASALCVLKTLEEEISRCILSEDEMADSASPELAKLRRAIVRQNEAIKARVNQIVSSADNRTFLQDAIVTMRQGRYVIPVKQEYKSRLSGIVHDQSASGATLFVEPQEIVNMNNELRELELAERKEVQHIIEVLSNQVGRKETEIIANQEILFKLDYLFAKGRLACNMNASRPEINDEYKIRIRRGRHPLIPAKKVVPIDVSLGEDYDTLVVTGPNTGGKTVTLKTVGLLCLMAQAGLFVPADHGTTLPVFKDIFADIGDEQSIEQSLSTFSSHMTNIVDIVNTAKEGCLVLLDELGAGTDPTEGAALAMSVLNHLFNSGAKTIATTHYTELKKYAISTPGVQNASMQFDVETLSPTYKLIVGVPGKSNAFEISQKLGLDSKIIDQARGLLEKGDIAFEDVLTTIEQDKKMAEADRNEAEALRKELEKQKERMESLRQKLEDRRTEIIEEAKLQAKEILDEAEKSIKDIQKAMNNKELEEARKQVRDKKKKYAPKSITPDNPEPPLPDEIEIGIRVNVLSVGEKGKVLSLPDDKGDLMVQVSTLKLSVNLSGITLVQENVTEKQREKTKYSRMFSEKAQSVSMSINVIGKSLDDALMDVDKYLDDAMMAGLKTVTIIHGRGAGILRNGIGQFLKKNKYVENYRKGEYTEGGDGVTVVNLK